MDQEGHAIKPIWLAHSTRRKRTGEIHVGPIGIKLKQAEVNWVRRFIHALKYTPMDTYTMRAYSENKNIIVIKHKLFSIYETWPKTMVTNEQTTLE